MKKKEGLRKLIRIFFILLPILGVLEFLSIGFTGYEFFTGLFITLPGLWRTLSQHPERYMSFLCGVAIVFVLIVFFRVVFPFLVLIFSQCRCYFTLWLICLRHGHTYKISRAPLRSLAGVGEKPDITIGMGEKTLQIHFIDIPFATRRVVTLLNRKEYYIRPTNVYRVGSIVFREENRFFRRDKYRKRRKNNNTSRDIIKQIPTFSAGPAEYHVMVILPGYATMYVTHDMEQIGVGGETWYEDIMLCRAKVLKRRLRGEMRTSFGPPEQK